MEAKRILLAFWSPPAAIMLGDEVAMPIEIENAGEVELQGVEVRVQMSYKNTQGQLVVENG